MCSCIWADIGPELVHISSTYDTTVFTVTGLVGPFHSDTYRKSLNMKNRF